MKILYDMIFKESYETFGDRYCKFFRPKKKRFMQIYKGPKNEEKLWKRIDRYADKVRIEDCHDMPEKFYNTIYVEMTPEEKKAHNELLSECLTEIGGAEIATSALLRSRKLTQITSGFLYIKGEDTYRFPNPSKIQSLSAELEKVIDSGKKAIVWAGFHESIKMICEMLEERGWKFSLVSGYDTKLTDKKRHKEVWNFKNKDNVRIIVANPSMLGVGTDLSVALHSMYYENDYRLEFRVQSEARNRTHESKEKHGNRVIYTDFIAKGSIDRVVLAALQSRKDFLAFINKSKLSKLKG